MIGDLTVTIKVVHNASERGAARLRPTIHQTRKLLSQDKTGRAAMLDKLFRAHSEKNGLGEKNGGAAMNGTASTKEVPGVRRELSERPTPDMLRRTDSMTAFHAQKEFQDRTVSIGNDEREYFVSGCLLLLDCARGDLERRPTSTSK